MARIKNLLHDVELSRIPMFCREGRIKLPFSTETPMVMIGQLLTGA
jgi:sulfite reductase alpha subunit-like flavoprotein